MSETLVACEHAERFETLGGGTLCETCARIEAGWRECKMCSTLVHPDDVHCDSHRIEGTIRCEECGGKGWYECEGMDCHGSYCDGTGDIDCDACGGSGVVKEENVA